MQPFIVDKDERDELRRHLRIELDGDWGGNPTDAESGREWMARLQLMEQLGWEEDDPREEFSIELGDDEEFRSLLVSWHGRNGDYLADDITEQMRFQRPDEEVDPDDFPVDESISLAEMRANCEKRVAADKKARLLTDSMLLRMRPWKRERATA